jgi:hypothetical protein
MRKLVPLAVCGILLMGCTSTQSMMITEDTALITVLGQSDNGRAKLDDKALAEAARVTRQRGFRYFVILDGAEASQSGVKLRPGEPIPFRFQNRRTNLTSFFASGATYTTPDEMMRYVRFGLDITIRMYREGDVDPAGRGVRDSDVVLGSMAGVPSSR